MLNTKEFNFSKMIVMKNYDWSGFTKAEKEEACEDLSNAYERLFWYQAKLQNQNQWNDFRQVWSHDEAKKNIERAKKSILYKEKFWNITNIKKYQKLIEQGSVN